MELKQDCYPRFRLALIYLLLGRLDAYRDVCQQIFAGIRDDLIASTAYEGVWACAIVPRSIPNLQGVVPLVREAIVGDVAHHYYVRLASLGALLYRIGQTKEAVETLTKASRAWVYDAPVINPKDVLPAYVWYFLAMAHHDLAHYQEARTWFDKAEAYSQTRLAKPAAVGTESGIGVIPLSGSLFWSQRVVLEYLQREARAVLNAPAPKAKPEQKEQGSVLPTSETKEKPRGESRAKSGGKTASEVKTVQGKREKPSPTCWKWASPVKTCETPRSCMTTIEVKSTDEDHGRSFP